MSVDPNAFNRFVSMTNDDIKQIRAILDDYGSRIRELEEQNRYLRNTLIRVVATSRNIDYDKIEKVVVSEDGTLDIIVRSEPMPIPMRENPYA